MFERKKIIVVGGNAAGPAAAAKAKRTDPDAEVILFEAADFISTGTCELPYVISGEIEDYEKIVYFDPDTFFRKKGVKVFTKHLVENINIRQKKITVKNLASSDYTQFQYDKLILTTGSKAKTIPNLSTDLENVFTLKSVSDLVKIKGFIETRPVKKVLIIGAGYIGLETAEAFVKQNYEVSILEITDLPMPEGEQEVSNLILELIRKNNVKFLSSAKNTKFNIENNKLVSIKYNGRFIEFDLVVVAVGVKPNADVGLTSKLELGKFGGFKVDSKLKTSDPNIFAAGDNIEVINKITGRPDYMPVATVAHDYAHIAGANAAGANEHAKPVIKNIAVKIFDRAYCQVGLSTKQAKTFNYKIKTVYAIAYNLVKVMPESRKVFGKVIYETENKNILGAAFLGGQETIGYADLVSSLIYNKVPVTALAEINYNYTPPYSPFVNLLSVLGRKIKEEIK